MRHVWHEESRCQCPTSWLGAAAPIRSGVVLACPKELVVWTGGDSGARTHALTHDALSIAAAPDGKLVCVGEDETSVLTAKLEIEQTLRGVERPDPNHNGGYAVSAAYLVHPSASREVELLARSVKGWSIVARCQLGAEWMRAPTQVHVAGESSFLIECPQEGLAAVAAVSTPGITFRPLPFTGAFLGFLDDGKAYACSWDGRVTISKFANGERVRDFSVGAMTPVTVPTVFTEVANRRGVSSTNAEWMFDDVFVDPRGRDVPFALWTGSFDGRVIFAVHEEGTLRTWRPAIPDPYRAHTG